MSDQGVDPQNEICNCVLAIPLDSLRITGPALSSINLAMVSARTVRQKHLARFETSPHIWSVFATFLRFVGKPDLGEGLKG